MSEVTIGIEAEGSWRVISQTGEYALRAVLYISSRPSGASVPVVEIARALEVPEKYLARVLNTLRRAGVLSSVRGSRGGFQLGRPAARLPLLDVVVPFEAVSAPQPCLLRAQRCGERNACSAHEAWHSVGANVRSFFQRTTVADLLTGGAGILSGSASRSFSYTPA